MQFPENFGEIEDDSIGINAILGRPNTRQIDITEQTDW